MGWEASLTVAVIALCFAALASGRIAPDVALVGGVAILLIGGVLTPQQAFAGLANEAVVTIGVLYIVVAGLKDTGAIAWMTQHVLGRPRSLTGAHVRLLPPAGLVSAVLNNTPVVAMFLPAVQEWARQNRLSVSKLLMPLSFVTMAGGTITLIGTSTNLVVVGLIAQRFGESPLALFDLAPVGIPILVAVIAFIMLTHRWLLPDRKPVVSHFDANMRQYTAQMMVAPGGPLAGKSIEAAGLRHLPESYLAEIERGDRIIAAVSPDEVLQDHDRLMFVGTVDSVADLRKVRGLLPATDQVAKLDAPALARRLVEAVVSQSNPMIGKSVREGRFRNRYNAVIIAVARHGEQLKQKIGDIKLQPGDMLLLEAPWDFVGQYRNSRDFLLVSGVSNTAPVRHNKALLASVILAAMVLAAATGFMSMLDAAFIAAGLMVATRCCSMSSARNNVDWQVLVAVAASFALGTALYDTGVAGALARGLLSIAGQDPWLTLVMVCIVTTIVTEIISNNAAAALVFPIAIAAAEQLGVSYLPFAVGIMIAASNSFATPIGYQTNLMVYGPGGYRFSDYLRLGIPLDVLVAAITVTIVPWVWPFHP